MTDFFARTAHHRAVSECFWRKTPRYNGQAHDDRYCALSHFSTSGRHLIFGFPPIAHYSANLESAKRNSCSGGNGHGDRKSVTIVPNARRLRASRFALGIESSICCDRALQALCGFGNGTGNGEIINYILQDHAIPSPRASNANARLTEAMTRTETRSGALVASSRLYARNETRPLGSTVRLGVLIMADMNIL